MCVPDEVAFFTAVLALVDTEAGLAEDPVGPDDFIIVFCDKWSDS
jgi:hypothetical protein